MAHWRKRPTIETCKPSAWSPVTDAGLFQQHRRFAEVGAHNLAIVRLLAGGKS
jgi:hypothetical protein